MPDIGGRQSVMPEPSWVISVLRAYMSSTAARSPAIAPMRLPLRGLDRLGDRRERLVPGRGPELAVVRAHTAGRAAAT